MDDLVKNSMNILEPSPVDATGNDREDGMKFHFHVTAKSFVVVVVVVVVVVTAKSFLHIYIYKLLHRWGV